MSDRNMNAPHWSLEVIDVASPCHVPWESMHGDEQVRHCDQCRLNVYNLSSLTRADAESLVREKEGHLCIRFLRRHDGTMLTRDCPIGLRAVRRRMAQVVMALGTIITFITLGVFSARRSSSEQEAAYRNDGPLGKLAEWLDPPMRGVAGFALVPSPVQPTSAHIASSTKR